MKLSLRTASISAALLSSSFYVACDDSTAPDGTAGDVNRGGDGSVIDGGGGTDAGGTGATSGGGTGGSTGGSDNLGGLGGEDGLPVDEPAAVTPLSSRLVDNMSNAYGSLVTSTGKVYVSGATDTALPTSPASFVLAVWRFNADGSPDTTWGTGGKSQSTIPSPGTSYDIIELADGSLVVHYSSSSAVYLVKVSAAGVFAEPVKVEFSWSAAEVAALNDDCVEAAATAACVDARTTTVGGVCETGGVNFNTANCAAQVVTCRAEAAAVSCQEAWPAAAAPLFAQRPGAYASWGMALDTSGAAERIVVFAHGPAKAGTGRSDSDRFVTRVLASDLSFDATFNEGAPLAHDVSDLHVNDGSRRGFVEPNGAIVSAGYTNNTTNHITLIRLLPDGTLDENYGFSDHEPDVEWTPGQTYFNAYRGNTPAGYAEAYGAARLSDGSVITVGYGSSAFEKPTLLQDLVISKVLADGTGLDTTYGGNSAGAYLGNFAVQSEYYESSATLVTGEERGRDVIALADDRTVHAGLYDGQAALYVVTEDGDLDESVGGTGRILYRFEKNFFSVNANPSATKLVATSQQRDKVTTGSGSYPKTLVVVVDIAAEDD